jgi:Tol biopolymer transport system component
MEPGTQLGHYAIVSPLGAGGMGEVWRARDMKLDREVALKMLPERFADSEERLARFAREAKVLASLNHPNIAAIYGMEDHGPKPFLVLELVEGETLSDRLKRGPLTITESLETVLQIAGALEAAHDRTIVHRDLKPANIKVTPAGEVKVLDFGLAKALAADSGNVDLSNSPTVTSAGTMPGVILGTAAYMSPEQARGKEADRASDLWAFGCVLYEMLSGRAPFEGETVTEILHGVLKVEPDWTRLPSETPEAARRLLRRCLRKDPKLRLRDARDASIEIEEALHGPGEPEAVTVPEQSRRNERLAWAAALIVTALAAAIGARIWRAAPNTALAPEMRLEITTPPTTDPLSFALSPDGQKIVFVASYERRPRLWLRTLASASARPLAGTNNATFPFWSPDSRSVGFFADGDVKRIDVEGQSVQALTRVPVPAGAAWSSEGMILFAPVPDSATIYKIPASGGKPTPLPKLESQTLGHRFPQFLPDGRRFLYYATGDPEFRGIYVGNIDGSPSRRLFDADSPAAYAASGHLLFVRQGTLFAQSFDAARYATSGNPHPVAEQVASGGVVSAALSVSAAGPIAYRTGSGGKRQLAWMDRSGKVIGRIGEPEISGPRYMSLSPDNRRIAEQRSIQGNTDIWLLDLERGAALRFTTEVLPDIAPIWSPGGDRIVFSSVANGLFDLYEKLLDGTPSKKLLETGQSKQATDWSSDGKFILFRSRDPETDWDVWALPLTGERKPLLVVRTRFQDRDAQFSPDGKWIAYQSDESGRFEIYVQPFPGPGVKSLVSTGGGAQARWSRDGKELFYMSLDGRLMAVSFRAASDGRRVETGAPVPLFFAPVGSVQDVGLAHYVVSPDGQRFLMDTVVEETGSPITLILNWKPD